jgi:hypothetical protein
MMMKNGKYMSKKQMMKHEKGESKRKQKMEYGNAKMGYGKRKAC